MHCYSIKYLEDISGNYNFSIFFIFGMKEDRAKELPCFFFRSIAIQNSSIKSSITWKFFELRTVPNRHYYNDYI